MNTSNGENNETQQLLPAPDVVIEPNVPIPDNQDPTEKGKWKAIFAKMKVGDSFVLDSRNSNTLQRENCKKSITYLNTRARIKEEVFRMTWRRFGPSQIRVWRIR